MHFVHVVANFSFVSVSDLVTCSFLLFCNSHLLSNDYYCELLGEEVAIVGFQ